MPSPLELVDRYRPRTERAFVERVVAAVRAHVARPDLQVSLLLTDDREIAALHKEFLDDPTPTDVMSFELDGDAEIVVSVETARRVAKQKGHTIRAECALYIVHGILHTVGYDDIDAQDRARMRDAERAILQQLGLKVHAVDA
ncbi:MAG: rRNA maturation RNase YbeY [Planctomycetota bacterium]